MSISITFVMDDQDETPVTQGEFEKVPRKGEVIWFVPSENSDNPGPCRVMKVCYWLAIESGNNYQAACVYLEELK